MPQKWKKKNIIFWARNGKKIEVSWSLLALKKSVFFFLLLFFHPLKKYFYKQSWHICDININETKTGQDKHENRTYKYNGKKKKSQKRGQEFK